MTSALDTACHHGHFALVEKLVDTYSAAFTPLRRSRSWIILAPRLARQNGCGPPDASQCLVYEDLEYFRRHVGLGAADVLSLPGATRSTGCLS